MNPPVVDFEENELASYAYSYPHKSSYRPLDPPRPLDDVWQDESRDRLALYAHIPFCEMRCGFCNLFTQSQPEKELVENYLATLRRQTCAVRERLGTVRFRGFAIGGGTPTWMSRENLTKLLEDVETTLDFSIRDVPTSVETSPSTATPDRLQALAAFGVERISIGVQSFNATELGHMGRPQQLGQVLRALTDIREAGFPVLNIDLIYGDTRQSMEDWTHSLEQALRFSPEEIYLYPLYVRPETGLARNGFAEYRGDLHRAGRDLLRDRGYRQMSLRCFRLPRIGETVDDGCQRDGMIGLGCGARSYTRALHYSTRFAVTQAGVRAILADWIRQSDTELGHATHGIALSEDEQRRRFLILGLLQATGMTIADYKDRFDSTPDTDFPELAELRRRAWLSDEPDRLVLTEQGLEKSDVIGPLLYSKLARARLQEFVRL